MQLDGAIKQLFPEAVNGVDFILQDDSDGEGPFIKEWNLPDPQPTQAELAQAETVHLAAQAKVAYKELRKREYPDVGEQMDALWKRAESAGLVADPAAAEGTPEKMLADINAVKTKHPKPA